jgi:hypothetical protein
MPLSDTRFASVHETDALSDAGPEDEPRDPHGRWTSGSVDPSREDIEAIAEGRLQTHRPGYGTEQDEWPDGSREKRSYWTHDPKIARSFYPEEGRPALIRAKRESADFKSTQLSKPNV